MSTLNVTNLYKSYGDVEVIKGVNFRVEEGKFLSLLGPSGCGKTTILRMIAGLIMPTSGNISVDDREITFLPPYKRNMGMVFQNYALFPHMTVEQNVAFGLKMRSGLSKKEIADRIGEGLDLVRLGGYGKRYPRELSGGQQQRVALARVFVLKPSLLLLDEPLSNLDAKLRAEMRTEIRALQKRLKLTTLFVTHDQEEALTMSDVIGVLHEGNFAQFGTPEELYEQPCTEFVASFIGKANLFRGEIAAKGEAGVCLVSCGTGSVIRIPRPIDGTAVGDRVTVSVRPERMSLHRTPSEDERECSLAVEVLERIYIGSTIRFTVRVEGLGDEPMGIDMPPFGLSQELGAGSRGYIRWPAEASWLVG